MPAPLTEGTESLAQARGAAAPSSATSHAATERKVQAGMAIALACLCIVGVVAAMSIMRLRDDAAWVTHTWQVISRLDSLLATVNEQAADQRGFVITGDESFVQAHAQSVARSARDVQELRALTADSPDQMQRLAALEPVLAARLARSNALIDARRAEGFDAAQHIVLDGEGRRLIEDLRRRIGEMQAHENSLLADREQRAERSTHLANTVIASGAVLALAVSVLALIALRRDFAGRRRAEAELERFFSLSLDFLCIASADGYFKRVSPAVTDVLGWSVKEFLARPFLDFVHPDDHGATLREVEKQVIAGEKVLQFENRYRHKNGSWRVLAWRSMPQPDGLMYATARDVTELRAAERVRNELNAVLEEKVRERTDELAKANESLQNREHRLQSQLAQLALLSEVTRAIGERQDVASIFQVAINTVEEQLPVDFAFIGLHDALEHVVTVSSVGQRSQQRAGELGLEPKQRVVIDQNGLSVCVSGRLVYEQDVRSVPSPFPQRLARAGLRSMVAAPLLVESKVFGVLVAARAEPEAFSSSECEFLRQLSEHVALAAHQAQLYGDLQNAYDELRQTQQAVMQQERLLALGQMASGIAHDINNAISPVTLYTESLLETEANLSPRTRGYLETIQRAIDDVAHTVARMREFYRQREPQLTLTPVDLNSLVPQVVELTRARWSDMAQLRGLSVTVRTELAPDLPAVLGIESELREALINLIFNAVDAMQKDGPLIIRTRMAQLGRPDWGETSFADSVVLEVVDSGVGMDDDTRRRCLEPFFTTKGERGTGLGLAMVYGSMQRHGADIEIESAPGQGTTVRLCFAIQAEARPSALKPRLAAASAAPLRILLVDDDPLVLKSLRDTLEVDGHTVRVANGGQSGIDLFREAQTNGAPFDVVITDLGMPYVDGRKVSATIKAARSATRVIMLTGWGQRMLAEGTTPDHVDRVLGKPPKLRELREALTGIEPAPSQEMRV